MKKIYLLLALLLAGLTVSSVIFASNEEAQAISDEVVAMCEEKYNAEEYTNESERSNLIDNCIDEASESAPPPAE